MTTGNEILHNPTPEALELERVQRESTLISAELLNEEGVLRQVAQVKVAGGLEDDPRAIASVIVADPDATDKRSTRADLIDKTQAETASREVIKTNSTRIIGLAQELGMRKLVDGVRQAENIDAIDPEKAVYVVEGGANKSSVIRRGVAIKGMREVYWQGDEPLESVDLSGKVLYQFGAARQIKPTKERKAVDGSKEIIDDPEYKTIHALAGDHLDVAEGEPFTEFQANLATALADGYEITSQGGVEGNDKLVTKVELRHRNPLMPQLVLIQPAGKGKFKDGLTAIHSLDSLAGKQLVMATNGQYRRKDEYIAATWAEDNGVNMLQAVGLGDEPGDIFTFKDGEVETDPRADAAYINELVILWYLGQRRLRNRPGIDATGQSQPSGQVLRTEMDAVRQDPQTTRLLEIVRSVRRVVERIFDIMEVSLDPSRTREQSPIEEVKRRLGGVVMGVLGAIVNDAQKRTSNPRNQDSN